MVSTPGSDFPHTIFTSRIVQKYGSDVDNLLSVDCLNYTYYSFNTLVVSLACCDESLASVRAHEITGFLILKKEF